jgi:hypothetical protein
VTRATTVQQRVFLLLLTVRRDTIAHHPVFQMKSGVCRVHVWTQYAVWLVKSVRRANTSRRPQELPVMTARWALILRRERLFVWIVRNVYTFHNCEGSREEGGVDDECTGHTECLPHYPPKNPRPHRRREKEPPSLGLDLHPNSDLYVCRWWGAKRREQ